MAEHSVPAPLEFPDGLTVRSDFTDQWVRTRVQHGVAIVEPEGLAPGRRVEALALAIGPDLDECLGAIVEGVLPDALLLPLPRQEMR